MCKQFAEAEFCELGEDCHFAHGQDELRLVRGGGGGNAGGGAGGAPSGKVGAQYKTSICKQWTEGNTCQVRSISNIYLSVKHTYLLTVRVRLPVCPRARRAEGVHCVREQAGVQDCAVQALGG